MTEWGVIRERLAAGGLNLWGVAKTEQGSAVVVGNAGGTLWEHFVAHLRANPERLASEPHPLNRYVAELVSALPVHPRRRWALATDRTVPLRQLARDAGLGFPSRLGLLLHPTFGPWLGLRAVCFTDEELPPTGPLPGQSTATRSSRSTTTTTLWAGAPRWLDCWVSLAGRGSRGTGRLCSAGKGLPPRGPRAEPRFGYVRHQWRTITAHSPTSSSTCTCTP
jgi:hypothetical protein